MDKEQIKKELTEWVEKREKTRAKIDELAKVPGRITAANVLDHESELVLRSTLRTIEKIITKLEKLETML